MNKILRTLLRPTALIILIVTLVASVTPATASAGFFGLVGQDKMAVTVATLSDKDFSATSFDSMYDAVRSISDDASPKLQIIQGTSILGSKLQTSTKVKPVSAVNVKKTYTVNMSAYSSTPDQTDDSPFITANGEHVYWGGVAANIIDANGRNIPFGTKIRIPKLFGDQIFTINDRMNKRYNNNVDIWFADRADAREFGRKTVTIEVIS